ncbi:hemerythrin domain-containing protein [Micromonospora sp. AP08]|uniref:hemerythrin domain-containing protein n=1 Tax=Micromonospora sp. AP08 TaxID=2604467 RepID=UPI0011D840D1|nr:hemerythrin domain-containing protein [Micromonospora sp. AP08]TYB35447.1 hemerythrin domain-containing protein [Micromonospora sp. AP08]
MCNYCGCRQFPLIGRLSAEHEAITDAAEHDDIHGVLGAVDRTAPDWPPVLAALDRLHRHVDNEEHGLFPAAVIALPIPAWDRITPAADAAR